MKKTKDFNSKTHVGADPVSAQTSKARQNKGITLIALIITIIVMLILVAVTISMAINGGLFGHAGKAVSDTQNAIDREQELGSGKVTIGDREYSSINDYVDEMTGNIWPIEWNTLEVMENTSITIADQKFVKISNYIPTKEELEKAGIIGILEEQIMAATYMGLEEYGNVQAVVFAMGENQFIGVIATKKGYNETLGIEIKETGIYVMDFGGQYNEDFDLVLKTSNATAILVEDGTFYFTCIDEEEIGEKYHNSPVVAYYTGIEFMNYGSGDSNGDIIMPEWILDGNYEKVEKVIVEKEISPISTSCWFAEMESCKSIDISLLQTNQVSLMGAMFYGCESLTTIKWGTRWDTSNVTNMGGMFGACRSLSKLNVSNWDVSKVEIFGEMFDNCKSLVELDLSTWETSSATSFFAMFISCENLKTIILGDGWDTSNVNDMNVMFADCSSLLLDCSGWDVSNVTNNIDFNYDAPGVIPPKAWQTAE